MADSEDRIRLVLVSPGDLAAERTAVQRVIEELNRGVGANRLVLWRWEADARPGLHLQGPQGLIDDLMDLPSADVVIGVFWRRFGTPTHDADSGTEHELRRAWAAWREHRRPDVMVYFSSRAYAPRTLVSWRSGNAFWSSERSCRASSCGGRTRARGRLRRCCAST